MRVIIILAALLGMAQSSVLIREETYIIPRSEESIAGDYSPMALLAHDYMPHIKTRKQLWMMQEEMNANMNQFVDRLLANLKTFLLNNGLDPIKLPDFVKEFHKKVLWITWHGEVGVYNGNLKGLSTIHRSGDVTMDYKDNILYLDANIGFNDLEFYYDFRATFMGIGPRGYVTGTARGIGVHLKIHVDLNQKKAALDLFQVTKIQSLTAKVHGLGSILDWLLDMIADIVLAFLKGKIADLTDKDVGDALKNIIANFDLSSILPFQVYKKLSIK